MASTQHLNYGLIGCGMMGQEHLRNIALLDNTNVTTIFEPDAGMRATAATLTPNARFVDGIDAVITDPDVDCLVITSPNHLHLEQIERIAELGAKPLLVEKPLYTDPREAARVAALQHTYPAPIWVAMEYRYMPAITQFLDQVNSATGGIKMLTIREHRFPFLEKVGNWNRFNRNSGGTLVEKCCHFFDLMRHAMQSEVVRVMASAGQTNNHLDECYEGEVPDIWDNGYVILDFANGSRAMLELCMFAEGSRYQEKISAIGPSGMIEANVPGPGRFWDPAAGPAPIAELITSPRASQRPIHMPVDVDPALLAAGDHNGATFYQHQKFAAVARGAGQPEVGLMDGAKAVAIGLAAQESAATGTAVTL